MADVQVAEPLEEVVEPASDRRWARGLLAFVLAAAIALDLAVQSHVDGLAMLVAVVLIAVGLLVSGRVGDIRGLVCVALAVVFAAFLTFRVSPWLVPFDLIAAYGLLAIGAAPLGTGGTFGFTRVWWRLRDLVAGAARTPAFVVVTATLARPRSSGNAARPVVAGLALALPLVIVLAALLASADAVFASYFEVPFDAGSFAGHLGLTALCGLGVASFFVVALTGWRSQPRPVVGRLGWEVVVVLAAMVALFSVFVATQALVAWRGSAYVLDTTGLTYAEHARSGFFQLLFVVGITWVTLLGLASIADLSHDRLRRWFVGLAEIAIVLTLAIAWTAFERLALYEEAFGLTMLRLSVGVFIGWIAVVLVLLGLALASPAQGRRWLLTATAASAFAVLAAVNIVNPEALVVHRNVSRPTAEVAPDLGYLASLSADAVPALIAELAASDPVVARELLCDRDESRGIVDANASASSAQRALVRLCGSGR